MNFQDLLHTVAPDFGTSNLPGAPVPAPAPPSAPMAIPALGASAGLPAQPPQRPQPRGGGITDTILQIAPLLVQAFMGRKNPNVAAASIQGWMRGQQMAEQERASAQEAEQERRLTTAKLMQQFAGDALKLEDPEAVASYLDHAENVLRQVDPSFQPGTLKNSVKVPASRLAMKQQKEAAAKLAQLEKQYPTAVGTPEFENATLPDGSKVSELRRLSGLQLTSDTGTALAPAQAEKKPDAFSILVADFTEKNGRAPNAAEQRALYFESQKKPSPALTEWQDAVANGYKGTFEQYQNADANRKRPVTNVYTGSGLTGAQGDLSGDAFLQTLNPNDRQLVKLIADYKMDIARVTSLRGNERTRIARLVAQYDPSFDMTQYGSRARLRGDFSSGKAAANVRSLNTAVGHLKSLSDAGEKLQNSSTPLWNTIKNTGLTQTGDARVVRFNTAATAVEGELAAVFKGMGATDQEIKVWRENLNASQSPAQLKAAITQAIELMGSRLQALSDQWTSGIGKPKDFRLLSAKSRDILKALGVDVDGIDPGGGGETAGASQTSAPATLKFNPQTGKVERK